MVSLEVAMIRHHNFLLRLGRAVGHAALVAVADLRSQRRQWTQLSGPRLASRSHDMIAWTKLPSSLVTELYEEFVGKRGR